MSDLKDEFLKDHLAALDLANQEAEVKKKKNALEKKRIDRQFQEVENNEKEEIIAKTINFGKLSMNQIDKIRKDNFDYLDAARTPMEFICPTFRDVVPFFRKNLIVIGAPTGKGKSTVVANVAKKTMMDVNRVTGKRRRVLILTNEEEPSDLYNRVTALFKGLNYTNHNEFTDEERKIYDEYLPRLAKDGWLTIIGSTYVDDAGNTIHGVTSTPEGVKMIFENLIANEEWYDVVLLDYYQNCNRSKDDPSMDMFKAQEKLCIILDDMKNRYPAPIVVLAQMLNDDEKTIYDQRIKGRKMIAEKATVFLEMESEPEKFSTKWTVRKGRYVKRLGKDFRTSFDRGNILPYDPMAALKKVEEKQMAALSKPNLTLVKKDE